MKITKTEISGAWIIESQFHSDNRGEFSEVFKKSALKDGLDFTFLPVQSNFSISKINVIRGIHYSLNAGGQAKYISCLRGEVMDFVVDIRPNSQTFGKWISINLKSGCGRSILIAGNLGHAFVSLEEDSHVNYLLDSEYAPEFEYQIDPFDKTLKIDWPGKNYLLSEKDKSAPSLLELLEQKKLPSIEESGASLS